MMDMNLLENPCCLILLSLGGHVLFLTQKRNKDDFHLNKTVAFCSSSTA